jgi:pheromone shutdown protein TraB
LHDVTRRQYLLKLLSCFERHESKASARAGMLVKLFVVQVVNTAVLVLLINGNAGASTADTAWTLFGGSFGDFDVVSARTTDQSPAGEGVPLTSLSPNIKRLRLGTSTWVSRW